MISLLPDLQAKELLGRTPVVLGTKFGRTARIDDIDGQDQHIEARACWPELGARQWMGDHPQRQLRGHPTSV
jgi:hypothetical protein